MFYIFKRANAPVVSKSSRPEIVATPGPFSTHLRYLLPISYAHCPISLVTSLFPIFNFICV